MSLDGWSNVHNEPILCVTISTPDGHSYLLDTIDTTGHSHAAEYLLEVVENAIVKCEEQFSCHVGSFVTDNAANMAKMRRVLKDNGLNVITYGCSAHLLNLLAHDMEITGIKDHIVQVVRYFRNHHLPAAWYKQAGGNALVLPQDVRWNTLADCIEKYLQNWPILLQICEEHRNDIQESIYNKVQNIQMKRCAEHYLSLLKPIAVALDVVQRDTCSISEAVNVWKNLEEDIQNAGHSNVADKVKNRMKQACTPAHLLSNILDPRFRGNKLSLSDIDAAMEFAGDIGPQVLSDVLNYRGETGPFKQYMFQEDVLKMVTPLAWWKCQSDRISKDMLKAALQVLGAKASSADVERVFSTFGLVQSQLRNRLGTEKSGKLVYMYKLLNPK